MAFQPNVDLFWRFSVTDRHEVWERSRLEWRVGDRGDPAALAAAFMDRYGLGLPTAGPRAGQDREHAAAEICGAALFISAAAGAAMLGVPAGARSPYGRVTPTP